MFARKGHLEIELSEFIVGVARSVSGHSPVLVLAGPCLVVVNSLPFPLQVLPWIHPQQNRMLVLCLLFFLFLCVCVCGGGDMSPFPSTFSIMDAHVAYVTKRAEFSLTSGAPFCSHLWGL